ncbi:MAG: carbonic anhydrase [Myxococcota bacterium]
MDHEAIYRRVFDNNVKWVMEKVSDDADFFERLAKEQLPDFLYIGCADSRVPANQIMGLEPGDVFVHRNLANLVVNTDLNAQSVIEYAVEQLHVKHIVVCGHYGCGGIAAAMQPRDLGLLNGWLREVRDVYRLHQVELDAIADPVVRQRRLVELNIDEQCNNVIKTAAVQRHWLRHGYPVVHGWVYDLHNGLLRDLQFPFEARLEQVRRLYRLTLD